jgi:hypothetical protein
MSTADPAPSPIPVEAAVATALRELQRFIGHPPANARVEEVFPPDDEDPSEQVWLVTLSYLEKAAPPSTNADYERVFGRMFPKPPADERVMRVMVVDAWTGKVVAMRVREAR